MVNGIRLKCTISAVFSLAILAAVISSPIHASHPRLLSLNYRRRNIAIPATLSCSTRLTDKILTIPPIRAKALPVEAGDPLTEIAPSSGASYAPPLSPTIKSRKEPGATSVLPDVHPLRC
jgi:hypothetical protein